MLVEKETNDVGSVRAGGLTRIPASRFPLNSTTINLEEAELVRSQLRPTTNCSEFAASRNQAPGH